MRSILFGLPLLLLACGGNAAPPTTPTSGETHGEHGKHHEEHHAKMAPAVHEFHEELAPLWHMEKGPDRAEKTCKKVVVLKEKATATGDKELLDATVTLATECDKPGRPDFDARFKVVHERFHALAEK